LRIDCSICPSPAILWASLPLIWRVLRIDCSLCPRPVILWV
jgi:hypothetical protein